MEETYAWFVPSAPACDRDSPGYLVKTLDGIA
jgi:hypothetical protein